MCAYSGSSPFLSLENFLLESTQTLFIVASGVLIIPTVLLNGISVLKIWKSSHLKAKLCYFLVLIQLVADLAVGAVFVPRICGACSISTATCFKLSESCYFTGNSTYTGGNIFDDYMAANV